MLWFEGEERERREETYVMCLCFSLGEWFPLPFRDGIRVNLLHPCYGRYLIPELEVSRCVESAEHAVTDGAQLDVYFYNFLTSIRPLYRISWRLRPFLRKSLYRPYTTQIIPDR